MQGAVERLGYIVVPKWRLDRLPLTRHLHRLFALLEIDLIIDVGANAGQYRDFLRDDLGFAGDILSFEPVPELAAALIARSASDPRWTVHAAALGAAEGALAFNVMKDTQFSSFRAPVESGVMDFGAANTVERVVEVPVKTLHSVLAALPAGERRGIYLKLDTQGFDLEVLRGVGESLSRIKALQFEASFEGIYADMPRYAEVIEHARSLGYTMSGLYPNNPEHFPVLIEADCVMVRRDLVAPRR